MSRLLIVDDDAAMCRLLEKGLASDTTEVATATSAEAAMHLFEQGDVDVVVTDIRMPGGDGLQLCERIVASRPDVPVIVVTAFGSMATAVDAIRAGAYDFITKPFELDRMRLTVQRALSHRQLHDRLIALEGQQLPPATSPLLGGSAAMTRLRDMVERVSPSDATVLIRGESGTGKELVARTIHDRSRRADGPFVAINCAAMPATLLESELFGHVRGAFTDAKQGRTGMFEAAADGTLFLDEIGELPLELQPKLLRALQERSIRPVGSNTEIPVTARIVAATNRDLEAAAKSGSFREDLYYRLAVIEVEVPPLRARGNDILLLVRHYLDRFATPERRVTSLTPPAARKLLQYEWPGNVRELSNCIERAVTLARFNEITVDDLPPRIAEQRRAVLTIVDDEEAFITMDELEQRYITRVYEATGRNKSKAARILGFNRKTLHRKLVRYGMASDDEAPPSQDE